MKCTKENTRPRQYRRRNVVHRFGQWGVTKFGLENLTGPCSYDIDRGTLACVWLRDHMHDKNWVVRADFDAALDFARQHFGIKTEGGLLW